MNSATTESAWPKDTSIDKRKLGIWGLGQTATPYPPKEEYLMEVTSMSQHTSNSSETPKLEPLWNVSQLASYLKCKPSTIYQWVEQRRIPYFRIYKRKGIRFQKSLIDQWLKEPPHQGEKIEKKILEAMERPPLDIDQILREVIAEAREIRYTSRREKPGEDKGLGKEGDHGNL